MLGPTPIKNKKVRLQFTKYHKNWQKKIEETLPGLRGLNFHINIWMVGLIYDVNNMKIWVHPVLVV